ncbi:hypothetical protein ACFE04_017889 [Oxalis oulophora]
MGTFISSCTSSIITPFTTTNTSLNPIPYTNNNNNHHLWKTIKPLYAFVIKTSNLQTQTQLHLYNSLIQTLSNDVTNSHSSFQAILLIYLHMLTNGPLPDTYTIPYVLKACAQCQALPEGQQIHAHSIKMGVSCNVYVNNTLMRMYAVCGHIGTLRNLFDRCPHRDLVSWTTLIQAFVKMASFNEAIDAFLRMCESSLVADEMMLVIILSACAKLGDLSLGRKIHAYIVDNNVKCDVFVYNALVDMYLKCGDTDSASCIFDGMLVKNVVSWNSMISGLAYQGKFTESLDRFRKMQGLSVKPDSVTLVAVLNSCANLGMLELGKWVHAYIDKNHIKADGFIGNALMDMYAKCACIQQAYGIFQEMKFKDVFSYTTIIVGLAINGEAQRALNIFYDMPKHGTKPDEVTFIGVLSACSHAGLVDEGVKHFHDMSMTYNLKPQTEHYGCLVDLLGRAGLIHEALKVVENMPMEPDGFVWGALLGACKIHGQVELGEKVVKKLVTLEPEKDGAYILMSNLYSSANRWRDAVKVRKAMKEMKMKKTPGCSSVEIDGVVYEFRRGDKSNPKSKDVYKAVERISSHLKDYGDYSAL